ncbi:hypothetical protein [Flavisericum labens]|uniref:hypothetical protein n=1 Tax=Flavisericum labens TaxID=3377112 RepID=UPI00387A965C
MKKCIFLVGVGLMSLLMFLNTPSLNESKQDFDLSSLLNINKANAECGISSDHVYDDIDYFCEDHPLDSCTVTYLCDDGTVTGTYTANYSTYKDF